MRHLLSIVASVLIVIVGYNIGFQNNPTTTVSTQQLQPVIVVAEPIQQPVGPVDPFAGLDADQVHCLAKNIYFEARGESVNGKVAVANVTMNRVAHRKFPNTVCEVVEQAVYSRWWKENHNRLVPVKWKCQFTWFCDGKSDNIRLTDSRGNVIKTNLDAWQDSINIAVEAVKQQLPDTTNGATHYYNPSLADPNWADHYQHVAVIENHSFHRK